MNQVHHQFDLSDFYADFLTKGYYVFDGSSFLKDFDIEQFNGIQTIASRAISMGSDNYNGNDSQIKQFEALGERMSEIYLKDLEHKLVFAHFWSHILPETYLWHRDGSKTDGWPILATINCYFDDANETTGGLLQFHPAQDTPIPEDSPLISSLYPKRHMVVILNQTEQFFHRITPTNSKCRRIIAYALPQQ